MSFSNSIYKLPTISGYPQAHRYFNETRKPPRSKRWEEHQRPLYTVSARHYRIERSAAAKHGTPEYYDLMLYGTPLVRYFQPEADGSFVMFLHGHSSNSSRQFLWRLSNFGHASKRNIATDTSMPGVGTPPSSAHVPLSPAIQSDYVADNGVTVPVLWSAVLTCVPSPYGPLIDTTRSAHRPIYAHRTSSEATTTRTAFTNKLKPYIDILMLSLPSVHASTLISTRDGRAFRGVSYAPSHTAGEVLQRWVDGDDADMPESLFKVLQDILAAVYRHAFGAWVQRELPWSEIHKTFTWHGGHIPEHMAVLPTETVRSALLRYLRDNICPTKKGDKPVDLGQFPVSIPKTYYYK